MKNSYTVLASSRYYSDNLPEGQKKNIKTSVRIINVAAEIRSKHLSVTSEELFRCDTALGGRLFMVATWVQCSTLRNKF
jgi:hypothetical protein